MSHEILNQTKVAVTAAVTTISSGIGMIFDLIPDDIGKLATLVGIVLSSVLIRNHIIKGRLEVELLKEQLKKIKDTDQS